MPPSSNASVSMRSGIKRNSFVSLRRLGGGRIAPALPARPRRSSGRGACSIERRGRCRHPGGPCRRLRVDPARAGAAEEIWYAPADQSPWGGSGPVNHKDPREVILNSPMSRMQVVVVAITIALNALDGFDVLSISLAAPAIRSELGIGPAVTGLLLSMELIGMAIGSIFLGRLADAWGRRPMMLSCLVLMTAGMFLVTTQPGIIARGVKSLTDSLGVLEDWPLALVHISVWRIITGLGIGGLLASINAVVAEYSNSKKKHMNVSLMSIGYPVGASLGGFVASWLLIDNTWRSVFYLGFGMTAAMIPIVYFFVPETVAWQVRNPGPGTLDKVNATLKKMGRATIAALPDVTGERAQQKAGGNIFAPRFIRTTAIVTAAYFFHIMTFYFILKWTGVILVDRGFAESQAGAVLSWVNVGG